MKILKFLFSFVTKPNSPLMYPVVAVNLAKMVFVMGSLIFGGFWAVGLGITVLLGGVVDRYETKLRGLGK